VASNPTARALVRFGDLRHTFATRLISDWSRRGEPVPHYLVLLSRYMGHKQFNATWWYVSPDCSSLKSAMQLFRRFQQNQTSNDSPL
jgi:integrase